MSIRINGEKDIKKLVDILGAKLTMSLLFCKDSQCKLPSFLTFSQLCEICEDNQSNLCQIAITKLIKMASTFDEWEKINSLLPLGDGHFFEKQRIVRDQMIHLADSVEERIKIHYWLEGKQRSSNLIKIKISKSELSPNQWWVNRYYIPSPEDDYNDLRELCFKMALQSAKTPDQLKPIYDDPDIPYHLKEKVFERMCELIEITQGGG